jgi:hypothetical protein
MAQAPSTTSHGVGDAKTQPPAQKRQKTFEF